MSRITDHFWENARSGKKAFIPFITAGDPDLDTSLSIIVKLADLGADVIEVGVPFSDPMADGPTIQLSSQRSLERGTTLPDVLELIAAARRSTEVPIVLFTYFNPVLRFGLTPFRDAASRAGADGVLLTDVIEHEADEISRLLAEADIDLISLVAPTTSQARLRSICEHAKGFIYAVSLAGVTGARDESSTTAEALVRRVKQFTKLPVAVGFGISTAAQIQEVWQYADAAVVGSAIVSEIAKAKDPEGAVERVNTFVLGLLPQFAKAKVEN
ncbi:MAG: tryptophan synthase subunit alpha [Pyrinomonadaceae bacterium]